MRKFASLLTMLMLLSALAFAQKSTVTGTVKDDKGLSVPFATITEIGTNNATTADVNGFFRIVIKEGGSITISATGHKAQTITPNGKPVSVTLAVNPGELAEVVVTTAFGIKQAARTTPYSSQTISNEALNIVPHSDLNAAIAGKVAGVQFRGQSAMKLNTSGFLRIRGGLSLGDVAPVYVIDGNIVNSFDINPDDIQELNVLKGANATALFGDAAKDGAIVITTKKRGEKGTSGIELNQGITIDKAYLFPQYQNTFGGGAAGDFTQFKWVSGMPVEWQALDGKYYPDYTDDSSWGPRMAGQEYVPWYAWFGGHSRSYKTALWVPQPDNAKNFWNTGITNNTNVSFSKAGQGYSARVSYTYNQILGMIPNSASERHTVFSTMNFDLNNHFSTGADITFVDNKITGEFNDAYSNQSSGSFDSWFHRDLDMGILKSLSGIKSPVGTLGTWNLHNNPNGYSPSNPASFYDANYWYNFYSYFQNINDVQVRDRIYGDVFLKYTVNSNISLRATVRKNELNTSYENITKSVLQASALQTGLFAGYGTGQTRSDIMNYELIGQYHKNFFSKLDVNATVGGNWNRTKYQDVTMSTRNGLSVPDLYAITNSAAAINYGNTRQRSEVRSLFGTGAFEWNKLVSVTWALRNDWYSTIAKDHNSLFSPSLGASFVFSELTRNSLPWLTFGKIFGSWGKKPTSIGVYVNNFSYGVNANLWGTNFLMSTPDALVDPSLKGSSVTSYEAGVEFRLLNNRLGISATYYNEDNDGEPLSVAISGTSGYSSSTVNAAEVKREGLEGVLNATPIKTKNFTWDVTKTFGYLIKNPVVKLIAGQDQIVVARGASFSGFTAPATYDVVGKNWGQLIGMGFKRNSDGIPEIKSDGTYLGDPNKDWGSVVPKITGGLINSFTYKNFNLNFSIDYQIGGKFFSLSEMWGNYSGLLAPTAGINDKGKSVRDPVASGGGVHVVGVSAADEKTPVDTYVDAQYYFHSFFGNNAIEPFIHNLTYVKLREISFGYNIPVQKIGQIGKVLKGATFSVVSENTLLIYRESKSFDPSEISGVQGEDGQYPGTRSIGASLKLLF